MSIFANLYSTNIYFLLNSFTGAQAPVFTILSFFCVEMPTSRIQPIYIEKPACNFARFITIWSVKNTDIFIKVNFVTRAELYLVTFIINRRAVNVILTLNYFSTCDIS